MSNCQFGAAALGNCKTCSQFPFLNNSFSIICCIICIAVCEAAKIWLNGAVCAKKKNGCIFVFLESQMSSSRCRRRHGTAARMSKKVAQKMQIALTTPFVFFAHS
jgi:hypothetical protein